MAGPGKKKPGATAPSASKLDPVRVFAERVRDHKNLESRWAVLQEARVEYFRGKDFVALLAANPELRKVLGGWCEDVEDEDLGNLLLHKKLIVRCDRVVKTLRPGKKKLSKWPARIEIFPEQQFSQDDAFFAWTFERRSPLWQTALSILLIVVTIGCCLFPLFPHWCKLLVLYLCLAFLALILGTLLVRWAIFGFLWIFLGKRVWFFPNILAEEATFSELFVFLPDLGEDKDPPPKWTARVGFALVTVLTLWFLVHHSPDESARIRYKRKVTNTIDDILEFKFSALSGKTAPTIVPEAVFVNDSTVDESHSSGATRDDSQSSPSGDSLTEDVYDGLKDEETQSETLVTGASEADATHRTNRDEL